MEIDSAGYDRIAINFAQNAMLTDPYCPKSAPIQPVGYPFFLGFIYKIFGHSYAAVIVIQIILGLLCCVLTFLIAQYLFSSHVAHIALFFSIINIGFLTYPQFLLAETLLLFLLLLFWAFLLSSQRCLCIKKYTKHVGIKYVTLFIAGLCIGLSVLVKSSALLFIPVVALFLFFLNENKKLKITGLFLCGAYGPILLYMSYNYWMWGYFRIAPLTSLNLYHVFFSKVLAQLQGGIPQQYMQTTLKFTGSHSFDESGWRMAKKLFFDFLGKEPFSFLYVWLKNVCKSTFGLFSTQLKVLLEPALHGGDCSFFKMNGNFLNRIIAYAHCGTQSNILFFVALQEVFFTFIRLVMLPIGMIALIKKNGYSCTLLILLYIIQCLIITGFDGCARYRLICEPFIIILMSAGLWNLYLLLRKI